MPTQASAAQPSGKRLWVLTHNQNTTGNNHNGVGRPDVRRTPRYRTPAR